MLSTQRRRSRSGLCSSAKAKLIPRRTDSTSYSSASGVRWPFPKPATPLIMSASICISSHMLARRVARALRREAIASVMSPKTFARNEQKDMQIRNNDARSSVESSRRPKLVSLFSLSQSRSFDQRHVLNLEKFAVDLVNRDCLIRIKRLFEK